ncbi:2-amino-4-hydroxy-6-hydroxymethyldihydropteridine diphosphokinase [Mycetocola zhadangensis]|uniref:2-amino-4-hydroxy-6-hydroxymethyldihydropteridine diphosphokinase n=1 Tax=Mycetocola zhadangensis TaxID=1164595 RepID=A0A3L7J225_9MICO|nr:2-amino-4-hydroxy-6-hydroxymethyldihydropteridine diphosphokinase [Mycetocola zhadangensis]RLQ84597.1 2-amino-4-hydroxy-6-hydroxymethyldihydropteridine diphosphokinase [Mycetocola zhadangensis]GGE91549.1 2-amino-4-hydroxy-6-hydroxymethyldihydropteridine diphosphokinase [Mycetocola zhadangensis]
MTPIPKPSIHPPVRRASQLPGHDTAVVLALGSNLGDREATLAAGLEALTAAGVRITAVSAFAASVAVKPGGPDPSAPGYLNAVALVRTDLSPRALLDVIHTVEADLGRVRLEHWGDRTLDIDIVTFGTRIVAEPDLDIPHPRAAERDFVLAPWLEVDPDAELPGHGRVDALLASLRAAGASA